MQFLGIRNSANEIRVAILEKKKSEEYDFINWDSETKLKFPSSYDSDSEKILWLDRELEALYSRYSNLNSISIKQNELTTRSGLTAALRRTSYFDGVVLLFAAKNGIPIYTYNGSYMFFENRNIDIILSYQGFTMFFGVLFSWL